MAHNDIDQGAKVDMLLSKMELLTWRMDKFETRTARLEARIDGNTDKDDVEHDIWSHLSSNVTAIVGLREAVMARNKAMRFFWGVLLFCGICATALFVFETGKQYLEYRSATNVFFDTNASYAFPAMLFCYDGWMDPRKARATGLSDEAVKYSLSYFDDWHGMELKNATSAREEFALFYTARNFTSLIDYYKSITVDFRRANEVLEWADSPRAGYFTNMCDLDAEPFFLNTGGVCARFRLNPAEGGVSSGMTWNSVYAKADRQRENSYFRTNPTWYVFYSRDNALESNTKELITVAPSTAVVLKVSARRYKALKDKDCVLENQDFSKLKCVGECEDKKYRDLFGCKHYYLNNLSSWHDLDGLCNLLDPYEDTTLGVYAFRTAMAPVQRNISAACTVACPDKCARTYYDVSVTSEHSMADVDYDQITDTLATQTNMSAIVVTIQHTALSEGGIVNYEEVSTYSFVELVTDVGGTLGLFIGATVLTLIQMIVFLIRMIEMRWWKKVVG